MAQMKELDKVKAILTEAIQGDNLGLMQALCQWCGKVLSYVTSGQK